MRKNLNLFVKEENIIIGFTLIPHLIYGIREQYFCTSQLFNIGEKCTLNDIKEL